MLTLPLESASPRVIKWILAVVRFALRLPTVMLFQLSCVP